MILSHTVTYQGVPCKQVQFALSDGLQPDRGFVIINYEQLGALKVQPIQTILRATRGLAVAPGITPTAFEKISGTVAVPPPKFAPAGDGLGIYGDLVLTTYADGDALAAVTYRDIFVDPKGMLEIERQIKRDKPRGNVRVNICDIRHFYEGRNACFFKINRRLKSGAFDPTTVNNDGSPRSMLWVLQYVFAQLPGSPGIVAIDSGLEPPSNVIADGDTALSIADRLLDEHRLVPVKLYDNNYVIRKRGATVEEGRIATGANAWRQIGESDRLADIQRTAYPNHRPMIVGVVGARRVGRCNWPMVPVVQNERGRWERLEAFVERIGYSMDELNKQAPLTGGRSFAAIVNRNAASLPGKTDAECGAYRRILQDHAYKSYAPLPLFQRITTADAEPVDVTELNADDFELCPFLPVVDMAVYQQELLDMKGVEAPAGALGSEGDSGEYHVVPPIVWAWGHGDAPAAGWEAFRRTVDAVLQSAQGRLAHLQYLEQVREKQRKAKEASGIDSLDDWFEKLRGQLKDVKLGSADYEELGYEPGTAAIVEHELRIEQHSKAKALQRRAIEKGKQQDAKERQDLEDMVTRFTQMANTSAPRLLAIHETLRELGMIAQYAYGVARGVSVDRQTGIVRFSKPCFLMNRPFAQNPDNIEAVGDGMVWMSWGYERKRGDITDHTLVFLGAADEEVDPQLHVVGFSVPIEPMHTVEYLPNMRGYEDDLGKPMNERECTTQAMQKAAGQFKQPRSLTGFEYTFSTFLPASTEAGVQSVQHAWNGAAQGDDGKARTVVFANTPGGMGPAGPARKNRTITQAVDVLRLLQERGL